MKLSQNQIIANLKADKVRILTELNFIKQELSLFPDGVSAVPELQLMGIDVLENEKVKVQTRGGYFTFPLHRTSEIIELVKKYFPENLLPHKDVYRHTSGYKYWWSPLGCTRMPGPDLYFPMDEPDNIHNFTTALKSGNKGLIELFSKALDAGQVARLKKDLSYV